MFKKIKTLLVVTCCLLMFSSNAVFADTKSENDLSSESTTNPIWSYDVDGYTFTYENAPQSIKDDYDRKCMELGITPEPNAEIFIPMNMLHTYRNIDNEISTYANFHVEYYGTSFEVSGSKNYTVYVTTYVGYGHTTSGNPVHLVQILLGRAGTPVQTDSIFGTDTYNKIKSFQSRNGLSSDGVVGLGTWKAFSNLAD